MKILVFGGSFDPPHFGHEALLKAAAARIKPDLVLIVPAFLSPFKAASAASARDRIELVRSGLLNRLPKNLRRKTRIFPYEVRRGRAVYSFETLREINRLYPAAELHWVLGSDAASSFHQWKNPQRLRTLCHWWLAQRPGEKTRASIPKFFRRLNAAMPDVSATEIRRRLSLGLETDDLLAPEVRRLILRRGLYGTARLAVLQKMLKPERYSHTLHVARLASDLAARWGIDPEKAAMAGLLHDAGRSVPAGRMAAYARAHRLKVPLMSEIIRRGHEPLLHAYISEDLARRRFSVSDPEILSAIRKHTLGATAMSVFDRLLYVADATSHDRPYAEAKALRELAFHDLERAFQGAVAQKIRYTLKKGSWLHPLTISLWNFRAA